MRAAAHKRFDRLWQYGLLSRKEAYRRLAEAMNLPIQQAHFANFTVAQCQAAMDWSDRLLKEAKRERKARIREGRKHYQRRG
jgi:hypothetical protein